MGLTGLQISPRHVCSIATEIGLELAHTRDQKVVLRQQRQLPTRVASPPVVVAVEVDGGRLGTRAPGCGPGVHQPQPKEEKIACLVSMTGETYAEDPQPEPPASLMQPRRVQRLVRQIHGSPGDIFQEEEGQEDTQQPQAPAAASSHERTSPVKRVRTCVASLCNSHSFRADGGGGGARTGLLPGRAVRPSCATGRRTTGRFTRRTSRTLRRLRISCTWSATCT